MWEVGCGVWGVGKRIVRSALCVVRSAWMESNTSCAMARYESSTSYEPQATSCFPNPHPDPPQSVGSCVWFVTEATGVLSATDKSTSHKLQATDHGLLLPPPSGEVAAGRRGVVCQDIGCREWVGHESVSGAWFMQRPKPPARPSPRGGSILRTTNYRLFSAFPLVTPAKAGVQDRVSGRG